MLHPRGVLTRKGFFLNTIPQRLLGRARISSGAHCPSLVHPLVRGHEVRGVVSLGVPHVRLRSLVGFQFVSSPPALLRLGILQQAHHQHPLSLSHFDPALNDQPNDGHRPLRLEVLVKREVLPDALLNGCNFPWSPLTFHGLRMLERV